MSIRTKSNFVFYMSLFVCFVTVFSAAVFFAFNSTKKAALKFYQSLAVNQIERVEYIVKNILESGTTSVKFLKELDLTRNSRGRLSSYLDTTETTILSAENYTPYEKAVYKELFQAAQFNGNYTSVSIGNDDGQYIQAPDMYHLPPGYDPRLLPWYREALSGERDIIVTAPYKTVTDSMVFSVAARTYDMEGAPLGVLGVHYRLDHLNWYLIKRGISKTGYIVLLASDGSIIFDGRYPQYAITEHDAQSDLGRIASVPDGSSYVEAGSDEGAKYVVARTEAQTNWRIRVVFDLNEVMESPYSLLRSILFSSVSIFAIALSVLIFMQGRNL